MKTPFNVYDFFAILFPGTLALLLAGLVCRPVWNFIAGTTSWASAAVLVVVAYVAGEVVSGLSKHIVGRFRAKKDVWDKMSPAESGRLEAALREHYALQLSPKEFRKARFDLAFSLVWNRIPNYSVFLARADLNRSLSLLCGMATILGFAGAVGLPLGVQLCKGQLGALCIVSGLVGVLCFLRGQYFFELSRRVVYYSALEYLAERQHGAGEGPSTQARMEENCP